MASTQEEKWLIEYYSCFNATEAARRAGYKWPNKMGPAKKAKFADEIEAHLKETAMSVDEALYHLALQARANIGEYVTNSGLDVDRMKEDGLGALIKTAKRVVTQFDSRLEVDIYDKQAALDKILRVHGAYRDGAKGTEDDPVHTIGMTLNEWRAEADRRRQEALDTTALFNDETD